MSDGAQWECCSGKTNCCGGDGEGGMPRREFIRRSAAGVGAVGMLGAAGARAELTLDQRAALDAWKATLLDAGERRIYRGAELEQIAMPLGGIGCGQLYLGGKGDIVSWQILNNFNYGAKVNCPSFGIWAGRRGESGVAKLLVAGDRDGMSGFDNVRFSGEYPFAWIDFADSRTGWPVRVRLEAYSPFIPLDAKNSALPAVIFRFEVENTSGAPVDVSLLGMLPNLVGWDGSGTLSRPEHPDFLAQVNEVSASNGTTHVRLGAKNGLRHRIECGLVLATNDRTIAYRMRLTQNVRVEYGSALPLVDASERAVYWLGDAANGDVTHDLTQALERVKAGAGLIISGGTQGLLAACATKDKHKRAKTFEDWESGGYDGWDLEGECFAPSPVDGTLPGQQPVRGQHGKGMINTFFNGDGAQGVARSRTFTVQHKFIHLLVGGGSHEGQTCVNLVDATGKVLRSARGDDTEALKAAVWDVAKWRGQAVHIEIVDKSTEGWGHILLDDILFSDSATSPFSKPSVPGELLAVLPVRWRSVVEQDAPAEIAVADNLHESLHGVSLTAQTSWRLRGARFAPGARVLLASERGTPLAVEGRYGDGKIIVCLGDAAEWGTWLGEDSDRRVMCALVARAGGRNYTAGRVGGAEDAPTENQIASTPHHGTMALSVRGGEASTCAQWDDVAWLWSEFAKDGALPASAQGVRSPGKAWNAAAASGVSLGAGEKTSIEFSIAWHFPNRTRTQPYGWGPQAFQYDHRLGNQYNNHFKDALEVAEYAAANRGTLEQGTRAFHQAFYSTTAPRYFLDAITANISILRSPIYVWLEDGTVGGFEGSDACCPMNCTHVYNYAMAMPYLFPELERNVRELDLLVNRDPAKNFVPHRTVLPLSLPRLGDEIGGPQHHALDGELGAILKLYREWKVCGDRAWFDKVWPAAKAVMQHVLSDHDADGDGVFKGEQPNTYDTHLFGSNMFIGGLYLGALRAAEELAKAAGDQAFAEVVRARYESGAKGYDAICWDGEYYYNVFNAPNVDPVVYNQNNCYGPGCHADQVLGQWWAYHLGLGDLCDSARTKSALAAVHRYNWRPSLAEHHHTQRVFAEGDEKGLLVVTWPKGGRPEHPMLYCDEVWTGIEYSVAGALLHAGMVTEALQIIRGTRDRYTGNQRNPWSEIECGGHYARAMSSYALLHAAGGIDYDAAKQRLAIAPRFNRDNYKTFFSTGTGWGVISFAHSSGKTRLKIEVRHGEVSLRELRLDVRAHRAQALGGHVAEVASHANETAVRFSKPVSITEGKPLGMVLT